MKDTLVRFPIVVMIVMLSFHSMLFNINGMPFQESNPGTVVFIWNDKMKAGFEARWFIEVMPSSSRWNDPMMPFRSLFPLVDSVPSENSIISIRILNDPPSTSSSNFSWSTLAPYDEWIEIRLNTKQLSSDQGIILLVTPQRIQFNQTVDNITVPVDAFGATIVFDLIKAELELMVKNLIQGGMTPTMTNTSTFEEPLLSFSWLLESDVGTLLNATITFDVNEGLLEEYRVTLLDANLSIMDELLITRDTPSDGFISGFDIQVVFLGLTSVTILIVVKRKKTTRGAAIND